MTASVDDQPAEPLLRVTDLAKRFGDREVLRDVTFEVPRGSVQVLLGPSGSGKSTLIRCLNGLETIDGGRIEFGGATVVDATGLADRHPSRRALARRARAQEDAWRPLRTRIGMVFQSYDLFPNRTVAENIRLAPLKVQHRDRDEVDADMDRLLDRVQMGDYRDAYPRELSGGQRQRAAIVRALAMRPELMLFDEITASLDPEMVRGVLEILLDLARDDMTMIVVTHEMEFARRIADTVLFLDGGVIAERAGGAEFFDHPRTDRARAFLESMAPLE
jgi:polar amino acid transport system ATP-binding protein